MVFALIVCVLFFEFFFSTFSFAFFSFLCFLFQIYFVFIKYRIALFLPTICTHIHINTHTRYIWTKTTISAIYHRQTHNTAILNVAPQIAQKKQHPNVQTREFKRARQYHLTTPLHSATPARSSLS